MSVTYRCLSQEDVIAAGGLDMDACLEVIGTTLALHHRGETIAPTKAVIHWSDEIDTDEKLGRVMSMPAYVGGEIGITGMKWIPSVPSNPARGLPRGIGLVLLSDPETGLPLAFMDGTVVSAMRTGAVAGIAARELARAGAAVLGLLGAGVQARTQLLALERTLPGLEEIRIYDPVREKAERLAGEPTDGPSRRVAASPEEAVRGCDVVVPVTMAPDPFVPAAWLDPGTVAISVSSLDFELDVVAAADLLVADDLEHETAHPPRLFARAEAAGILDRGAVVTLGAIVAGAHPGRSSEDDRVVVSPIGLAIEDVAWAAHVFRSAEALGLGREQTLWDEPLWV
ncbi:MAG TPA: ornithine cyclodeaminase family protein [Methylomirabilota bacterium]|nr:ornithine cyclodeaminase family protein [Methylomirabilota bacterium]